MPRALHRSPNASENITIIVRVVGEVTNLNDLEMRYQVSPYGERSILETFAYHLKGRVVSVNPYFTVMINERNCSRVTIVGYSCSTFGR